MKSVQSAYIHIPFCKQMCHYCNFVKYYYTEKRALEYVHALSKEFDLYLPEDKNKLRTIYIGGGTPTALNHEQLVLLFEAIHSKFDISSVEEFTIELNPGELDKEKARILKAYGINRISFGVQVMDDEMLEDLGRIHRVKDVYQTVDLLHMADFNNISLDLIYSLPHQTIQQFEKSLKEALAFGLPHYSTYGLQIEPNTLFYKKYQKGQLHRPKEEEEVAMYQILRESMNRAGIEQYEISNFAKRGYESKHNLTYWNNDYYYGFGAGASAYLPGKRTSNVKPLPQYIKEIDKQNKPILEVDEITWKEKMEEELILGLRKIHGYEEEKFHHRFGVEMESIYASELADLTRSGLLMKDENRWKLTEKGMLLANRVFEAFILDEDVFVQL